MLSPCNTPGEDKFVVVELCEDIRIDTVQLANFEFFSGVFKDFSVSVARTYTTDPEEWTPAGTYRAKNIRGVQVRQFISHLCKLLNMFAYSPFTPPPHSGISTATYVLTSTRTMGTSTTAPSPYYGSMDLRTLSIGSGKSGKRNTVRRMRARFAP